ncbi:MULTISPECIES: hypothetical protein [Bacillus]|uniref:Uncharacterized protein YoaF n=3 Tax=Bacillus subtilis subsp. subtilis TaxID=135461 RepID=YOAF_BACSU|nr:MULTISPECIES: hypothetical protein [Bacillales]NP_389740.1 conserved protein of unknown function [Bacillus subtilis subsp. subtilis str. 168]O31829.1 RecName: Full=Uncharacterized protein YoaF [Bacillus subtilis subsp. subtilis str. 168]MDP4102796.1 hypothetical protein [Bacillota bacterium]BAM52512.1 hypothetical protein BEST7613_3581 [Bacillus subtilis BEST7613]ADV92764.1 hypothetical protein BSn5_00650 [Bacillus subtilis BSn5]AFQ57791.1 YoaF [Bacillus subtilis QB928]AGG61234.1 YoaF [Ba
MDVFLGIGIALAGYFIGEGLKQRNQTKGNEQNDIFLIKERDIYFYIGLFLGITTTEAKQLAGDMADLPYIEINGKKYVQKHMLKDWTFTLVEKHQGE